MLAQALLMVVQQVNGDLRMKFSRHLQRWIANRTTASLTVSGLFQTGSVGAVFVCALAFHRLANRRTP
ncbi:MAG: hypothetical protein K2Q07_06515 [Burkholderiaceae bacterium]|nr:hypothetical protein [Burkholderiaceae bacterium]